MYSMKHAIYIGKTVDVPKTGMFVNYGMTGVVNDLKGVTDNARKFFGVDRMNSHVIFEVDGKKVQILAPLSDLYFARF